MAQQPQPEQPPAVSARMLLEYVQAGELSDDQQLQDDGESVRSWLVFKLNYRTIKIPDSIRAPYERLLANYIHGRSL